MTAILRPREISGGSEEGSVLRTIRVAAVSAGIDPIAELYNEALELYQSGHYAQAQVRLHVLLGLAPSDGESHLLLANVLIAGQQWRRALTFMDEAAACGTYVDESLRENAKNKVREEESEQWSNSQAVREKQAEITRLKSEVHGLHTEKKQLVEECAQKDRETARWAWVATATSFVSILLLIFGTWHNMYSCTPAAHPPVAEVAASMPTVAKTSARATGTPATPKLPAPTKGPPATLPDTESCEEIIRPVDFPKGKGKFGAVCGGDAVYRIDSSVKEDGRFVHTDLVLLPDVVPP